MIRIALLLALSYAIASGQPVEANVENDGPSSIDPLDMLQQYNNATRGQPVDPGHVPTESAVNAAAGFGRWGIGALQTWNALDQSYPPLTAYDSSCMDLSTLGAPSLPSSCQEAGNAGCTECYREAEASLNGMRVNLERLKCYYGAYKRFVDASLAFGDSASGIHAVTGLEWQTQRAGIVAEMDNLSHAYDQKFHDMLPNLEASLRKFDRCETQYFHNADWYARFGNLYYAFMADRYKRN